MPRWSRWILVIVLVIVAGLVAGGFWFASSASPAVGWRPVPGLKAPVEVIRDDWSVPHIFAKSEDDAVAALGWVHAEDRMAQMEMTRRLGAGRLAEVVGPAALSSDRWMRTLGLYQRAEQQYPRLSERARGLFDAYARGVNAWLTSHDGPLPPEFLLLGITPEPWVPADSLIWLKLMAMRLSVDMGDELLRARLARRLSAGQFADLWPDETAGPTTIGPEDALHGLLNDQMLAGTLAAMPDLPGAPRGASNAWVVSGTRTDTGAPILANDPHLAFTLPPTWYLARLVTPEGTLAGATAPGFPAMVLGRNDRIAWGITSSYIDVEDVFVERLDPENAGRYLTPGGTEPFASREETIAVRRQDPELLLVRETRHGPVISDLAGLPDDAARAGAPAGAEVVLSLAATWLADDDRTADALFELARASDPDAFRKTVAAAVAPQQNVLYADVDGNIGFVSAGRIPNRPEGGGKLPSEGWSGAHDWQGFLPFEAQPQAFNPPSGLLVNANNRPVPADWPHPISGTWKPGFRAERITDVLAEQNPQSPQASSRLQTDRVSLTARRLLPLMLAGLPTQSEMPVRRAVELLRDWQGEMRADAPQPLLFSAWLRELVRVLAADELGPAFIEYWDYRPLFVERVLRAEGAWCDDISTTQPENCGQALQAALAAALTPLVERLGDNPDTWDWGKLHRLRLQNVLWSRVPLVANWLAVRLPLDGGNDTPLRAASRIGDPDNPFDAVHGAGYRAVYDLADLAASRFVLAGGQSSNPLSAHWDDQLDIWRAGGGLRLDGDQETLRREGKSRLQLVPAGERP
jgi:penicillin amidase